MAATANEHRAAQDTSYHDRRLAERLQDPEFRAEYDRQRENIEALDALVNRLDVLRDESEMSKAELARAIGKPQESVRRWLTTKGNPQLGTIIAMAHALGAEIEVVPKKQNASRGRRPAKKTRESKTAAVV